MDPNDAPTRSTHQINVDADLCGTSEVVTCLELNVPHDAVLFENNIIAAAIYFTSQDLDVPGAAAPQATKKLPNEEMLEHLLAGT